MNIDDKEDLFYGEKLILSKNANSIINISDFALKRLPYDQAMKLVGMANKEAIGGKIHLTNYRIIFKSHSFNRLTGKFSIFLNTINDINDISSFISKKIEIKTHSQDFQFVVWGIPKLINEIDRCKNLLTEQDFKELKEKIINDHTKLGDGYNYSQIMNNIALETPNIVKNVGDIICNPIALSSLLNVCDLINIINKK